MLHACMLKRVPSSGWRGTGRGWRGHGGTKKPTVGWLNDRYSCEKASSCRLMRKGKISAILEGDGVRVTAGKYIHDGHDFSLQRQECRGEGSSPRGCFSAVGRSCAGMYLIKVTALARDLAATD